MADRRPPQVRSALAGMAWPGLPARHATNSLALLYQLEHSQWLPAEELLRLQFRQINLVLRHAFETVPYYRARRHEWGIDLDHAITPEEYRRRVPILTRAEVQQLGDDLLSADIPPSHGKSGSVFTSGSTGRPIKVIKTELTETFWNAFTVRDHLWHRDPNLKLASIRPLPDNEAVYPEGKLFKNWGGHGGTCVRQRAKRAIEYRYANSRSGGMAATNRPRLPADLSGQHPGDCDPLRAQQDPFSEAKAGPYHIRSAATRGAQDLPRSFGCSRGRCL